MIKLFCLVLILSSLFVSMHGFKVKASAGYKDYNKAVFDALNKARKTPDAYYKYAQKEKARFVYTSSGSATNTLCHDTTFVEKATTCTIREETSKGEWKWNDAVNYLKYQMPQTELKWSEGLSKACYDHIKSQGPNGGIGKFESGQMPEMRANMYIMGNSQGSALAYMDVNYPEDPILRAIIGDRGDEMNEGRMAIFNGMATHAGVSCGCHSNYVEECCILVGQIYGEMNPSLVADNAPQLTSCTPYSSVTSDTKTGSFTLSSIDAPATSTSSTTGSTSTTGTTGTTSATTTPPPCPKNDLVIEVTTTNNYGMMNKSYKITNYVNGVPSNYNYWWSGYSTMQPPSIETIKRNVGLTML